MAPFGLLKRWDRVLAPHQIVQALSGEYRDDAEAVVFVAQPSKSIMPIDMMFLPLLSAKFARDPTLGMIYGTGSGCALLRKTAIQRVQAAVNAGARKVKSCRDFVAALRAEGFVVRQERMLDLDLLS